MRKNPCPIQLLAQALSALRWAFDFPGNALFPWEALLDQKLAAAWSIALTVQTASGSRAGTACNPTTRYLASYAPSWHSRAAILDWGTSNEQ
jgi:hypothetical protein